MFLSFFVCSSDKAEEQARCWLALVGGAVATAGTFPGVLLLTSAATPGSSPTHTPRMALSSCLCFNLTPGSCRCLLDEHGPGQVCETCCYAVGERVVEQVFVNHACAVNHERWRWLAHLVPFQTPKSPLARRHVSSWLTRRIADCCAINPLHEPLLYQSTYRQL